MNTPLHTSSSWVLLKNPVHCISLGFGSGLLPKAPGTWGTLAAVPFLWLLLQGTFEFALVFIVFGSFFGIWCTGKTAQALGIDDPGAIVWDEFIGLFISGLPLFLLESQSALIHCVYFILVFIIFRVLDIAKPFPVGWFDKNYHGGLGIMLDDIAAGIISAVLVSVLVLLA